MVKKLYNETYIEDIAHAIREKNGKDETYRVQEMGDAIREIPSGGETSSEKIVELIDYDGTVLYEYTKEEFLALEDYPEQPTHAGLTNMGWNWDLENAKEYITDYPYLCIGATYQTDNGETRLYFTIKSKSMLHLYTYINAVQSTVEIDWGDGSPTESFTGTGTSKFFEHTYPEIGDYVLRLRKTEGTGTYSFGGKTSGTGISLALSGNNSASTTTKNTNDAFLSMVNKIEFGVDYGYNVGYSSAGMINLKTIMLSVQTKVFTSYQVSIFRNDKSLKAVVFPRNMRTTAVSTFQDAYSLTKVSLPDTLTQIGQYSLSGNYFLRKISIPKNVTKIDLYAFNNNYGLEEIVILTPSISISDSAFRGTSLRKVVLPSLGSSALSGIKTIKELKIASDIPTVAGQTFNGMAFDKLELPSTTSLGRYCFQNAYIKDLIMPNCSQIDGTSLQNATITDNLVLDYDNLILTDSCFLKLYGQTGEFKVASVNTTIPANVFKDCDYSKITMQGNIERIAGANSFYSLTITEVNFLNNTVVPVLENANAFNTASTILSIIVPKNLYNSWIVAENWSSFASKIYYIDENGDLSQEAVA